MFAVRYVALAALAVWVGAMLVLLFAGAGSADLARLVHRIALVCGSVLLVALFTMKFVGPPPRAFPVRALVVAAMLVVAIMSGTAAARRAGPALLSVNTVAGLFLLAFYVRE